MADLQSYRLLTPNEFFSTYCLDTQAVALFELTSEWLQATEKYALVDNVKIKVHCLFELDSNKQEQLVIAWPLVHEHNENKQIIRSLTSFYSAVTSPFIGNARSFHDFTILLTYIKQHNSWQHMLLGPVEFELFNIIQENFKLNKTYSKTDNWYIDNITDFESYYQQRSSQLKNTIKRKKKKLVKEHGYHTKIIVNKAEFIQYFPAYQSIYQASWKGEEYSFAFIERVCLQAIKENKLRMGILLVDNQAVAVQLWFLQRGTASIFKLAYDPKYQQYSVGSILSMALSEYVIKEDKVKTIEFGMGSEPYKKDWMKDKKQRYTVQVFNEKNIFGLFSGIKSILFSKIKNLFK